MSCGGGVFGLHEDERHAGLGPICFDKRGKGAVVTTEERVGEEILFEGIEERPKVRCPGVIGNGFAVILLDKRAKWADADFKVWDETGVEIE